MQIGVLGPFEVRTEDGGLAGVPGARLRGLLIALALKPGHVVPKASLVDWIWGEHPPADATNALQRLVSRLRKALPDGAIEGRTDGYRLRAEPDAVDAVRFERLVAAGRAVGPDRTEDASRRARLLREALELWRGAALQDVGLQGSAALDAAVVRLEGLRLTATEEWAGAETALGHGAEMVTELTDLVAAHPLRERLVAALMRALAAAGRDSEALLVYQRAREALADALGVDPSAELAALHVALLRGELRGELRAELRGELRGAPAGALAGASRGGSGRAESEPGSGPAGSEPREASPGTRTNLRAELSTFVGKSADVAAVRALLAEHRLTTVTGPGGAGKTRLATETARTLLGDLPDGVWLVELAGIGAGGDVTDVARATLSVLGLRDTVLGGASNAELTDRLIAAVREREALLVLDNCEHVIESAAVFAHRLLGECRRLRILATSREPLGITGEVLWSAEPLALPEEGAGRGGIESSPAVRLLRDRAGAVRRDLAADTATLATTVRVCRALDGMPLAIELAAARLRTMTIEQLANRLDDRFRLLTGGSRTALPRHRTLRAVVDWSWELLSEAERTVLRRLSVFAGGASLEAAERVCTSGGFGQGRVVEPEQVVVEPEQVLGQGRVVEPEQVVVEPEQGLGQGQVVEPEQVLELLTALTEKSLLLAEGGDGSAPRYRMSGTVREYAAQRLAEAGEAERARHAHLAHFTELAETAEPHLRRAEQLEWLAVLEAEHDNVGAAMRGALAAGEAQAAMRLAAGAGWYWWLGGRRTEGFELMTAAAGMPGEVTDDVRAVVYALIAGFVSSGLGDENHAAEWIHEMHRFSRSGHHRHPLLGLVDPLGRMLEAPDTYLSAFEPLLDSEDPWVRALARLHMGKSRITLGRGGQDGKDADAYLEGALAEFRALGERFGISTALTELADRLAVRGEFAAACEHVEQAIAVATEVGATEDIIRMRARQAQLYWLLGDEDACAVALAEAQRYAERVTWPDALAELALAKAGLAGWGGDAEEARRQLGIAQAALGDGADRAVIRAPVHDLLGYLADDLDEAREHRAAACEAAYEVGYPLLTAQVLVGVADLALRRGQYEQAARLLAASESARGLPDRSHQAVARIEQEARRRLGDAKFAEAAREGARVGAAGEGARTGWFQLAEVTLAS